PLVESGYQPPIAEGFQRFLSEPDVKDAVDKAAEEHLAQARSDPYDSHPPDNQRIAALVAMPDVTPEGGASAPASTLVDGIDGIEPFLLIGILRSGIQLRQIRWQDAGTYAMLPVYVDRVRRQAHLLRGYTVGWLPEPDRLDAGDEADDRQEKEDPVEDEGNGDGDDPEQDGPAGGPHELADDARGATHPDPGGEDGRRRAGLLIRGRRRVAGRRRRPRWVRPGR